MPTAKPIFHLSRFDGIHVLALDGEFQPDGTLKGQLGGVKSPRLSPRSAARTSAADPELPGREPDQSQRSTGAVSGQRHRCRRQGPGPEQLRVQGQSGDRGHLRHLVSELSRRSAGAGRSSIASIMRRAWRSSVSLMNTLTTRAQPAAARHLPQEVWIDLSAFAGRHHRPGADPEDAAATGQFWRVSRPHFPRSRWTVHAIHAGFTGPSTGDKYLQVQQHMDELTREIVGPAN